MSVQFAEPRVGSEGEPRYVVSPVAREGMLTPFMHEFAERLSAELPTGEANNRVVVAGEITPGMPVAEGAELQGLAVLTPMNAYMGRVVVSMGQELNGNSEKVQEMMIGQLGRVASESLHMTKLEVYRGNGVKVVKKDKETGVEIVEFPKTYLGTRYL